MPKKIKDDNDKLIIEVRNSVLYDVMRGVLVVIVVLIVVYIILGLPVKVIK